MSIQKLAEVSSEIAAAKAKLAAFATEQGKEAIGAALAECFESPSNLTRIVWTQYTPYFNDGDSCTFGVHDLELYVTIDGVEHEHSLWELKSTCDYGVEARAQVGKKTIAAFLAVWKQLDEDILEAVFGDHVTVTVTADSVTVEECSHD